MKSDTSIRKFSWTFIVKQFSYNCSLSLSYVKMYYRLRMPTAREVTICNKLLDKPKDCWLVDPVGFFTSNSTDNEKCVYLHLATNRNWLDYSQTGVSSIPLYVAADMYDIEKLHTNRLLTINNETIDFKY